MTRMIPNSQKQSESFELRGFDLLDGTLPGLKGVVELMQLPVPHAIKTNMRETRPLVLVSDHEYSEPRCPRCGRLYCDSYCL